mmetsp:Transcript_1863/g.5369  ORF Transcript_1863/g.5369 Transcript_1863/m.5369 type:complete len:402 (+) Transcript_1863:802-2007(+)
MVHGEGVDDGQRARRHPGAVDLHVAWKLLRQRQRQRRPHPGALRDKVAHVLQSFQVCRGQRLGASGNLRDLLPQPDLPIGTPRQVDHQRAHSTVDHVNIEQQNLLQVVVDLALAEMQGSGGAQVSQVADDASVAGRDLGPRASVEAPPPRLKSAHVAVQRRRQVAVAGHARPRRPKMSHEARVQGDDVLQLGSVRLRKPRPVAYVAQHLERQAVQVEVSRREAVKPRRHHRQPRGPLAHLRLHQRLARMHRGLPELRLEVHLVPRPLLAGASADSEADDVLENATEAHVFRAHVLEVVAVELRHGVVASKDEHGAEQVPDLVDAAQLVRGFAAKEHRAEAELEVRRRNLPALVGHLPTADAGAVAQKRRHAREPRRRHRWGARPREAVAQWQLGRGDMIEP